MRVVCDTLETTDDEAERWFEATVDETDDCKIKWHQDARSGLSSDKDQSHF